jgi:hypothetical protein
MKLKQFIHNLKEAKDNAMVSDTTIENCVHTLKNECSEFLDKYLFDYRIGNFFYRGIGRTNKEAYLIGKIHEKRRPRDSSNELHSFLDQYFQDKFQHPYRSKVLFVTNIRKDAELYGTPYIIFFKNGFKMCYSDQVRDLYTSEQIGLVDRLLKTIIPEIKTKIELLKKRNIPESEFIDRIKFSMKHEFTEDFNSDECIKSIINETEKEFLYSIIDELNYLEEDFDLNDQNPVEIMVDCNEYVAVRPSCIDEVLDLI